MTSADFSAASLLRQRRFLPLFVTQLAGAFNDNVFKNALIIFITFHPNAALREHSAEFVSLAAGVFILPFFLFSALAGQLADKFEKSALIQRVKLLEIVIMVLVGVGFWLNSIVFLMVVLFLMGTQSSFFGPLKYSILPQHLARHELTTGNGLVQMATFLAILIGTMFGGFLVTSRPSGPALISFSVVFVALLGWWASRGIPVAPASEPALRLRWNLLAETITIARRARQTRTVFTSIVGISWFWFVGATYLQLLPSFTRDALNGDANVVTLMLTAFSVGIGVGSLLCAKISRGGVETRLIWIGGAGLALFSVSLNIVAPQLSGPAAGSALTGIQEFVGSRENWWVFFNLFAVSVCAGLYIVPLFSLMQIRARVRQRARVIAANNIFNALFMVMSALLCISFLSLGLRAGEIIAWTGLATAVVTAVLCLREPAFVTGKQQLSVDDSAR